MGEGRGLGENSGLGTQDSVSRARGLKLKPSPEKKLKAKIQKVEKTFEFFRGSVMPCFLDQSTFMFITV
jgi:hypothetical protein